MEKGPGACPAGYREGVPNRIVKRTATLADGRELIYYDDADTRLGPERRIDTRPLEPRPPTATMRQDVLNGEWISVAAARQSRVVLPPADRDPLAPQTPDNPSEIPDLYDVAVVENRSPSFGPALPGDGTGVVAAPGGLADISDLGFGRERVAVGRCEVVCFSPEHEGSFGDLTPSRARTVIEAWADRTAVLSELPGIEQVFVFENRGKAIGVTLPHPHGQIYAYPYVTPRTMRVLESVRRLGPDLFQRILDTERAGDRVVLAGEMWTAFVPFAARWPIEVHLLPHRHIPDLAAASDAERDELVTLYLRLLRGIDALYEDPTPYIAAWHQAPVHTGRDTVRLHLQLTSIRRGVDKIKYLAGSEAAMGAFVADIVPEEAAARIRAAVATG